MGAEEENKIRLNFFHQVQGNNLLNQEVPHLDFEAQPFK